MTVAELCQDIETRRLDALEKRIDAYPRNNPIASDLTDCTRETVLGVLHWKDRPLPDAWLKARFERGNLIENTVLRELADLGYTVRTERTPFEIRDKQGRLVLRGKVDGFLQPAQERTDYPMEVKSVNPNLFNRIATVEDFQRYTYMVKWTRQLQSYLYANNKEEGFFLLDDCLGHWKLLPVSLNYEATERIIKQCEQAVEHLAENTLPDYHTDPAVCRKCWAFGRVCDPPIEHQGLTILNSEELEQQLERRAELEAARREYEDLDEEIKATVKGKDGLVVGRFLIQGKETIRSYKAQEARQTVGWTTKITAVEPNKPAED